MALTTKIMGTLSDDLSEMGFVPTGEESPIDEDGELWTNGFEVVCDETGTVLDGFHHTNGETEETIYRYRNSNKVKLPGGYIGSYDWGHDGDRFRY